MILGRFQRKNGARNRLGPKVGEWESRGRFVKPTRRFTFRHGPECSAEFSLIRPNYSCSFDTRKCNGHDQKGAKFFELILRCVSI